MRGSGQDFAPAGRRQACYLRTGKRRRQKTMREFGVACNQRSGWTPPNQRVSKTTGRCPVGAAVGLDISVPRVFTRGVQLRVWRGGHGLDAGLPFRSVSGAAKQKTRLEVSQ